MIEVIEDERYFVLRSESSSLWCSKEDGSLDVHSKNEIMKLVNPECLGVVEAVIGKIKIYPEASWKMLLVAGSEKIGNLPPQMQACHKVTNLAILTLAANHPSNQLLDLKPCEKHKGTKRPMSGVRKPLRKTWNQFMNVAESMRPKKLNFRLPIGSTPFTNNATPSPSLTSSSSSSILMKEMKDKEKYEKRIVEELQKMFEESSSFYFTPYCGDLTNCTQSLHKKLNQHSNSSQPTAVDKQQTNPTNKQLTTQPHGDVEVGNKHLTTQHHGNVDAADNTNNSGNVFNLDVSDIFIDLNKKQPADKASEDLINTRNIDKSHGLLEDASSTETSTKLPFVCSDDASIRDSESLLSTTESLLTTSSTSTSNIDTSNSTTSIFTSPSTTASSILPSTNSASTQTTLGWRTADDRFFWNKHMISELIEIAENNRLADEWIIPFLQGFVQVQECPIKFDDDDVSVGSDLKVKLCIVSRRSRYRAGTRYKRRGVDELGHTANFVETEQIAEFLGHVVSYVQIRGSVPLYWSQTGIKYKPPPKIERSFDENHESFRRHLLKLINLYDKVNLISLVDQAGRERQVGEAYLQHIVIFNHPSINYTSFDFHEYCRGMKFENISILIESLMDQVQEMKYCWVDGGGMISEQKGVFRVNCIDCLDRTNIVQSAIARVVLEMQCRKLGLLSPERPLPATYRQAFQYMWANNGDVISRQYAGTAALKGDYTRTGERKLAGMMRDGVNSANRYYINRVKDVYRQACMDLMQGYHPSKISQNNEIDGGVEDGTEADDDLKSVVEECSRMIVNHPEVYIGGWGLVNADRLVEAAAEVAFNDDNNPLEMDSLLFLSDLSVYIADYDDDTDVMTSYKKLALSQLAYIQIGLLTLSSKLHQICLRLYYNEDPSKPSDTKLFYSWLVPGTRLNYASSTSKGKTIDEAREMLYTIVGSIVKAGKKAGYNVMVDEKKIRSEERSKMHSGVVVITQQAHEDVEQNLAKPPSTLSGLPTSNLPYSLNDVINITAGGNKNDDENKKIEQIGDTNANFYCQENEKDSVKNIKVEENCQDNVDFNKLCQISIEEHVQQTRHLQAVLKGLLNSRVSLNDHCTLFSCGLVMTRSLAQLATVVTKVTEVPEKIKNPHRQLVKLENKSKSLDASAMILKLKKTPAIVPIVFTSSESPSTVISSTTTPQPFKSSHSDYQLLQKTSSFISTSFNLNNSNNSPFIKLKQKVQQLSPSNIQATLGVPSIFNPSSHESLRDVAHQKLLTSQTRFQHLNSKVILL